MGRADDRGAEALLSEAEEEKDKDNNASEVDEEKDGAAGNSEAEDSDVSAKKYKCTHPGCDARFLRPSRLTWHLRKHNDERPYKCDREGCDRAYTNSSHLKRHLKTAHKEPVTKIYECKECGVQVGSLFSLKRHNKKIHDPERLTCHECGAKFRKKHCYNEHMSMHAGVAMYKCDICNQNFTQLRLLKKHKRVHDSKNYPCTSPDCNEIFDKWSQLSKHLATVHEFDYGCDKCEKMFKRKHNLVKHQALHANSGILKACPYGNCPRFYCYKKNLDKHIRVMHLNQRYDCDACGKSFKHRSSIIKHIQTLHEEQIAKKPAKPGGKKPRLRRKNAGVPTKSMVSKLTGVELPFELEKRVLRRRPRVLLKQPETEEHCEFAKSSGKIIKTISSISSKVVDSEELNTLEKLVKDSSGRPEVEVDDIRETSVGENSGEIVSSLPSATPLIVKEKSEEELLSELLENIGSDDSTKMTRRDVDETPMISNDERSSAEEENEAELLSALLNDIDDEEQQEIAENCQKTTGPNQLEVDAARASLISDLETDVPLTSLLPNAKPIVLA